PAYPRWRGRARAARRRASRRHADAPSRRRTLGEGRFDVARRARARHAGSIARRFASRRSIMSAFRFEAVDAAGRLRRGLLEADSAGAVRDRLRAEGLPPPAVDQAPARYDPLARTRLPTTTVALFTRQLATLVQSGMPLDQALAAVAEQADDARTAKIVLALRSY